MVNLKYRKTYLLFYTVQKLHATDTHNNLHVLVLS